MDAIEPLDPLATGFVRWRVQHDHVYREARPLAALLGALRYNSGWDKSVGSLKPTTMWRVLRAAINRRGVR